MSIPVVRAVVIAAGFVLAVAMFAVFVAIFAAASASSACASADDTAVSGEVPPWIAHKYDELKLPGESRAAFMRRMREDFGIFAVASKRYKTQWWLLAAVSYVESRIGQNPGTSYAGAQGPMQFMPGTWETYKDASGRPPYDVQDMYDAVFAAAKYLHESGAPGDLQSALFSYNHAQWYVDMVLDIARKIRHGADSGDDATAPAQDPQAQIRFPLPVAATTRPEDVFGENRERTKGERYFEGAEMFAKAGTATSSPVDGKVARAGWTDHWGYYVAVEKDHVRYVLARLRKRPSVSAGQSVAAGEVVGEVGRSGGSRTGAVLHGVETHLEMQVLDPLRTHHKPVRESGAINPTPFLQEAYDAESMSAQSATCAQTEGGGSFQSGDEGLTYPLERKGHSLGGVAAHMQRAWGNWQSDNAVDIGVPRGLKVYAVADGQIVKLGGAWNGGSGNPDGYNITLRTASNSWFYTHLQSRVNLTVGRRVKAGDVLGHSGAANGVNHLHIACEHGDPEKMLGVPK